MQSAVEQVLGNRDLLTQIFTCKVRRALTTSMRRESFKEAVAFIVTNNCGSKRLETNLLAPFYIYIDCQTRYSAPINYKIELFTTNESNKFFLFEESGYTSMKRRHAANRILNIEDLVTVAGIRDTNNPTYSQITSLLDILFCNRRSNLTIYSIDFKLTYIEKYRFVCKEFSELREEDPEAFMTLLRQNIMQLLVKDCSSLIGSKMDYLSLNYWLHLNCAALGIEDFSFLNSCEPVLRRRDQENYEQECRRLYQTLRSALWNAMQ